MTFSLLPTFDIMLDLYQKTANQERFQAYLQLLTGGKKDDLALPIGNYNPMAKPFMIDKILEMKVLDTEGIIKKELVFLSQQYKKEKPDIEIKVAINIADDLAGGWTNRYTTDYDSKFKLNGTLNRNFCVPIFWSSENYESEMIVQRVLEQCNRCIFQLLEKKPKTLKEHIEQESFVAQNVFSNEISSNFDFEKANIFFQKNKNTDNNVLIFSFLYGDKAAVSLGFEPLGFETEHNGYYFAKSKNNF